MFKGDNMTIQVEKIDNANLKITNTESRERILPKADIEKNIIKLEENLKKQKALLEYFKNG